MLAFWSEQQGFSVPGCGALNPEQAMSFQGLETMAQIAFLMLEGADKVLMATRHPSAGPLDIGA